MVEPISSSMVVTGSVATVGAVVSAATVVDSAAGAELLSLFEQPAAKSAGSAISRQSGLLIMFFNSHTSYSFSILQKFAISFLVPTLSKAISSKVSLPIFSADITSPLPNTL